MDSFDLSRHALIMSLAVALLAGCTAAQPPISVSGGSGSRIAPSSSGGALLYISESAHGDVKVFSYPEDKLVETLPGFAVPLGECTDAAGDTFVANGGSDDVSEFAHGGTQTIGTYADPDHHPVACSIDPTTGDVAATEVGYDNSIPNSVAVFTSPSTLPQQYPGSLLYFESCAYDPQGDLFVDGYDGSRRFGFLELPKGGEAFERIALNKKFKIAGNVQWDGSYIAVSDGIHTIYRFTFNGTKGRSVGSTTLDGLHELGLYSFEGGSVLVPHVKGAILDKGKVFFYNYPAGGLPVMTIGKLDGPSDAVVSPYVGSRKI